MTQTHSLRHTRSPGGRRIRTFSRKAGSRSSWYSPTDLQPPSSKGACVCRGSARWLAVLVDITMAHTDSDNPAARLELLGDFSDEDMPHVLALKDRVQVCCTGMAPRKAL